MHKPTNSIERNLLITLEEYNINTDITERWVEGIDHHPDAEKLAREIGAIDWLFLNDYFCWKFGGDGDNGEALMYILDILFDLRDAENDSQNNLP